jgi:hypothetical protein
LDDDPSDQNLFLFHAVQRLTQKENDDEKETSPARTFSYSKGYQVLKEKKIGPIRGS